MQKPFWKTAATALTLAASALALSACEVRRDGAAEEPEPAPSDAAPDAGPTPESTPSETPTASILRDDLEDTTAEPEPDEPAEPLSLTIPFPDGPEISDRAERMLVSALSSDAMDEDWPIVLGGHTDSTGNDQANLRSSRARAEAVAAWLVEYGVEDDRIEVVAFGEQNPVAPNARPDGTPNESGRRQNRRVELNIAPPRSTNPAPPAATPRGQTGGSE